MKYTFDHTGDFEMKATTFFGLEEVLQREILALGGKDIVPFKRGVSFVGDLGFLYKANLCLRTALKVIIPIHHFKATDNESFYNGIKEITWEKFIAYTDSIKIECVVNSDNFDHSLFMSQKAKDALVDRFRERYGKRPDVDLIHPSLRIYIHIFRDEVSVNIDSSGELLYKRGYRTDTNKAPINEILAAGLVLLSGWQPHKQLIDGMAGSGTIAIEAALIANNIPPGIFRNEFAFMRWKNFDKALFDLITESAVAKIKENELDIVANDIYAPTVKKMETNLKNAKLSDMIKTSTESFFDIKTDRKNGFVILNPPYGERIEKQEIAAFYKQIGDKFKKDFSGFTCWVITSSAEGFKSIGLRPTRKITLFNGSLECKFLKFEMYEGSKRDMYKKLEDKNDA
jgi:putative N6-adenine-specific DNA methylase